MEVDSLLNGYSQFFVLSLVLLFFLVIRIDDFDLSRESQNIDFFLEIEIFNVLVDPITPEGLE